MTHATRRTLLQALVVSGTSSSRAVAANTTAHGVAGMGKPGQVDTNTYPLTQATGKPSVGEVFNLGAGPDTISISMRAYNTTTAINVLWGGPTGKLIATNLNPAPTPPNLVNNAYNVKGVFGDLPAGVPWIVITPAFGVPNATGAFGCVITNVTYNGVSLWPDGPPGVQIGPRAVSGWAQGSVWWASADALAVGWGVPPASATPPSAPPIPVTSKTQIAGATINGNAAAANTLDKIIAQIPKSGTLRLPAGTIAGTSNVPVACTISGAGMGKTILDATGIAGGITAEKGVLVPQVPGIVISDMTIKGADVSDNNGAAVRDSRDGIGFTLRNVEVTGNQDGILTFASNIVLDSCNFHDNGAGTGGSHEMYINGAPGTIATLTNTSSTCGIKSTHAVKSRAGTTRITGGTLTGNPDASANSVGGSVVDIPNGGIVTITGTTLVIAARGAEANVVFLGYAMEFGNNQTTGNTVTLTNVHLIDKSGTGGIIEAGAPIPTAKLVIGPGCVYDGSKPPLLRGWASTTGAFARSGR